MQTLFLYASVVLIWGTTWAAIPYQLGTVPVPLSVGYRFVIAAVSLYAYAVITRRRLAVPLDMLQLHGQEGPERVAEVKARFGLPVMKAVGVPELAAVLSGKSDLDTAIAAGQRATRRYAKRQLTWFRNQPPPSAVPRIVIREQYSQRCWGHFSNFIRRSVLTV